MDILIKRIERLEIKILIYSDRDRIRTNNLTKELKILNMELLNLMVGE